MQTSTIVWIIVAIVVVAIIVAVLMRRSGARHAEAERAKAAEIRETASEHDRQFREREASATEARAQAEMARAEAKKRELDAERLAGDAESRSRSAAELREKRDEQARLADLRDPEVRTDKEGYRVDEQGNRLNDGRVETGAYSFGRSGDSSGAPRDDAYREDTQDGPLPRVDEQLDERDEGSDETRDR